MWQIVKLHDEHTNDMRLSEVISIVTDRYPISGTRFTIHQFRKGMFLVLIASGWEYYTLQSTDNKSYGQFTKCII
jgi:hypothetical protein